MAVLEAWANAKPVLMTPQCNLPEGFKCNAAISIDPTVSGLCQGLDELFCSSSTVLAGRGAAGRALVARQFAWPKIAAELKAVYQWIIGGGPKPDSVSISSG